MICPVIKYGARHSFCCLISACQSVVEQFFVRKILDIAHYSSSVIVDEIGFLLVVVVEGVRVEEALVSGSVECLNGHVIEGSYSHTC